MCSGSDGGSLEIGWISDPNSVPCKRWAAGYDDPEFVYMAYLGWNVCAGAGDGSTPWSVIKQPLSTQTVAATDVRVLHEP